MTIYESDRKANFPTLDSTETEHREELRQQAIALMYGWA